MGCRRKNSPASPPSLANGEAALAGTSCCCCCCCPLAARENLLGEGSSAPLPSVVPSLARENLPGEMALLPCPPPPSPQLASGAPTTAPRDMSAMANMSIGGGSVAAGGGAAPPMALVEAVLAGVKRAAEGTVRMLRTLAVSAAEEGDTEIAARAVAEGSASMLEAEEE